MTEQMPTTPKVEVNPGTVTLSGHRWRLEVLTESGMYNGAADARHVLMVTVGGGGGDSGDVRGELGEVEIAEVFGDPLPGNAEDGHQGLVLVLTRW